MPFLTSAKGKTEKRRERAEEIWTLCQQVCPIIYKDMQRVALMEYWDKAYFEKAFREVSKDYITISCFGMQLRKWDRQGRRSLRDRWLQIRVILVKYMDQNDYRFTRIEEHYNFMSLRGLPKITPAQRPMRLPRKWWDEHPNRDASLDRIALVWWRLRKAPPCGFEDICGVDVRNDESNGKTMSLKLEKALEEDFVEYVEEVESPVTKQGNGLRYLILKRANGRSFE
jgi:hypothetical protein